MTDLPAARLLTPADDEWPDGTPARITKLRVRGGRRLHDLTRKVVTISGRRGATPYGSAVAYDFAAQLTGAGYVVMTTGALGVAGSAVRGALSVHGPALVAPAGGTDSPAPLAHHVLFERAAREGAIIGCPSVDRCDDLLHQARLLTAWSAALVLIEPTIGGQSTDITRGALARGIPVLAVPGLITSADSAYAHALIRGGLARLVAGVADLLADLPAA